MSGAKKAKPTGRRRIVFELEGSEEMLERLATLLLFATVPHKIEQAKLGPMPWEDETDPRYIPPTAKPELNYELIRRDIVKLLEPLVEKIGKDKVVEIIAEHGAPKLSQIPQDNLLPLYHALHDRLNPRPETDGESGDVAARQL